MENPHRAEARRLITGALAHLHPLHRDTGAAIADLFRLAGEVAAARFGAEVVADITLNIARDLRAPTGGGGMRVPGAGGGDVPPRRRRRTD